MTKQEHIDYWISTSNDDFEVFTLLFNSQRYLHAFFIAHLSVEKLVKAHWVKDNEGNVPPKSHNLLYLVKQTAMTLSVEQIKILNFLNDFQIQGRYPDYKLKIQKILTKEYSETIFPKIIEIRLCLIEMVE
jgi:HEPN domain-containing protein